VISLSLSLSLSFLIITLQSEDLPRQARDKRKENSRNRMAFQAGYGLVELGAAAVPALVEAASTSETPLIRSRAIDVLGDIGPVSVITITLAI
jgi:HEAT repeat protein